MSIPPITPQARLAVYHTWRVVALILPTLGIALPGDPNLWDQLALAILGLTSAGAATLAIAHTSPAKGEEHEPEE